MKGDRDFDAALLEIAEREQLLLAEDLHDTLCPTLVGVTLLVKLALRRAEAGKKIDPADLKKISVYLDEAIEYSRAPFHGQSISSSEFGLHLALESLVSLTNKKIKCSFCADPEMKTCDPRAARVVFRIARETMRILVRQAQATAIVVSLREDRSIAKMEIQACGCGAASSAAKELRGNEYLSRYAMAVGIKLLFSSKSETALSVGCEWPQRPTMQSKSVL